MEQGDAAGYDLAELYGGAIQVSVPKIFTNVGVLYPIPDNQEVFRSLVTNISIFFELVNYLEPGSYDLPADKASCLTAADAGTEQKPSGGASKDDLNAVLSHLDDMCTANGDTYEILGCPKPCPIQLISAPTYTCQALVTAKYRKRGNESQTTSGPATPEIEREANSTCHFSLVRLAQHSTDMLVYINVPHGSPEEGEAPGPADQEETRAREVMANIMQSLKIVDDSLFGN